MSESKIRTITVPTRPLANLCQESIYTPKLPSTRSSFELPEPKNSSTEREHVLSRLIERIKTI